MSRSTRQWSAALLALAVISGAITGLLIEGDSPATGEAARQRPRGDADSAADSPRAPDQGPAVQEVRRPVPSSTAGSDRVRVVDGAGEPILGARIYTSSARGPAFVGTMDAASGMELDETPSPETEFTATAERFCASSLAWSRSSQGVLEIALSPGASLRGTVLRSVERTPAPGLRVVAWPKGRAPRLELLARPDSLGPALRSAVADELGEFTIDGVPLGGSLEVIAGGKGLGTLEQVGAKPGDHVVLEVSPIYAAAVEIVDEDGGPLAVSANYFPNTPPSWDAMVDTGDWIQGGVPGVVLAGVPPEILALRGPYARAFVLTTRQARLKRLGPITIACSIPGYRPAREQVWAESLESGELAKSSVRLTREGDAVFGEVLIYLEGVTPPSSPAVRREQAIGTLVLRDPASNERQAQIAIYSLSEPSPIRARLPAGRFTARYVARNGDFAFPPQAVAPLELHISDIPAEVHLDLSTLGSLELVVLNQDSTPFLGPWSCGLQRLTEAGFVRAGNPVAFVEGPYLLEGLPEGTYRCQFGSHMPVSAEAERATFTVSAGRAAVHVVPLLR